MSKDRFESEKTQESLDAIGTIIEGSYPSDRTTRNLNTAGGAIVGQVTLPPGKWIINAGAFINGLTPNVTTSYGYVANANKWRI